MQVWRFYRLNHFLFSPPPLCFLCVKDKRSPVIHSCCHSSPAMMDCISPATMSQIKPFPPKSVVFCPLQQQKSNCCISFATFSALTEHLLSTRHFTHSVLLGSSSQGLFPEVGINTYFSRQDWLDYPVMGDSDGRWTIPKFPRSYGRVGRASQSNSHYSSEQKTFMTWLGIGKSGPISQRTYFNAALRDTEWTHGWVVGFMKDGYMDV